MRGLLLAAAIVVTPALAAEHGKAKAEYGSWFGSASYFQFEGTDSKAALGCRDVSLDISDRYGFGLGIGYQFASGWSLEASWLRLHEDVSVGAGRSLTQWGQASDGFMVTGRVPLRLLSCCR